MPVQTDHPSGIGVTNDFGLWGSAPDKMAAVASDDGDASIIYAATGGLLVRQLFTFSTLAGVSSPVTSARIVTVGRGYTQGGGSQQIYHVWNSVQIAVNLYTYWGAMSVYHTLSSTIAGPTLAAVNGEHGIECSAAGGPSNKFEYWVTQLYREVTYDFIASASNGGFAYLIGSLAGALIGSNLLLQDISRLPLGNWRLLPHEYEPAWRAWNAQKRMRMA